MKKKSLNDLSELSMVFSTGSNSLPIDEESNDQEESTIPKHLQKIRIRLDTKLKGGKVATLVTGLQGSAEYIEKLCKELKQKCGVGGNVREGEILIQGNHVQKMIDHFIKIGYKDTKRSGG